MRSDDLCRAIRDHVQESEDPLHEIEVLRDLLHELCPIKHPVDRVRWIDRERVVPNDYNPNAVATREMGLLLHSIRADGYTQPVVTVEDPERGTFVIVDGFHRYAVLGAAEDVQATTQGRLPVVVIDKSINERMASTVRHNRARGRHSIQGMSSMVFQMLEQGMSDSEICNELGMEPEEILRLKHITGFSKLFEDAEYSRAWVARNQLRARRRYAEEQESPADQDDE